MNDVQAGEKPGSLTLPEFWDDAQRELGTSWFDYYRGTPWDHAVPPLAWSFGDSRDVADKLLALVLAGKKLATSSLLEDYVAEKEPLPKVDELSIVLDGSDAPRALIRNVEVRVVRFADVTAAQAAAEGEADQSLDAWRAIHKKVWTARGVTVTDDTQVVWQRFEVLYTR